MFTGSEVYITEITARLQNIFRSKSYNTEDSNELRKITFLLMLNTEVSLSRDLNEDFSICHLLNNFPQLSKCLFVNLVWQLKLEKYFYESIKYTPSWFMLQFLQEAIDSLRFSKPLDVIVQVKEIVESIYFNICRMDYKIANADQQVEQKIIRNKLFEFIMTLLRNYNTPNGDDEISKSKRKLKTYLGHSLNTQLMLVHKCFEMFKNKPEFQIKEDFQIYKLMKEKEPEIDNFSSKTYSKAVHESLSKINIALLNTLQNIVVNITLDDFMFWVEIDIDDPSTDDEDLKKYNLQRSIGEMSYNLIQLINANDSFEHNVVTQLETISIKPKTLSDITAEASVGTLLDKIESSQNKRVWFEELLNRPDTLFYNTECLQTIIDNIEVVLLKDLLKILKDHQNYGNPDREDEMQLKEILRLGGSRLSNEELRDYTEELIRVFGVDYSLCLEDGDAGYSSDLTNYLNKLTENNLEEKCMWKLIMLNPSSFFKTLLKNVTNQDKTQIEIVLKILNETSSVAIDYLKNNILDNLETASESPKSLYHIFLAELFNLHIMDRKEFLKDVLMDNLAKAMSTDKLQVISMLLSVLRQISGKLKVEELVSPLTLLVARILDNYRWDLLSFSNVKERIVESSIEIIQDLVKTIFAHGSKKDKDWILAKVNDCKPMTKFYFQKLTCQKTTFDGFLQPNGFEGLAKNKITSFLCEIVVRCTSKEFKWLMTNQRLQPFITDAVLVITVIVAKSNQQDAVNCLHKCVSDYVKVMKVNFAQSSMFFFILLTFFFNRIKSSQRTRNKFKSRFSSLTS